MKRERRGADITNGPRKRQIPAQPPNKAWKGEEISGHWTQTTALCYLTHPPARATTRWELSKVRLTAISFSAIHLVMDFLLMPWTCDANRRYLVRINESTRYSTLHTPHKGSVAYPCVRRFHVGSLKDIVGLSCRIERRCRYRADDLIPTSSWY